MQGFLSGLLLRADLSQDGKMVFLSVLPAGDRHPLPVWGYVDGDGLKALTSVEPQTAVRLECQVRGNDKGRATVKALRCVPAEVKATRSA